MSTAVFPTLPGLGFDVMRTPIWSNNVRTSVSGKRTAIGYWSYPRWRWSLKYNFLRGDITTAERQQLENFFNLRQGNFDTFLYEDADDNAATLQAIGVGDGSNKNFQLVYTRTGGTFSFVEPVLAPKAVAAVYVDGVLVSPSGYTVSNWGSANPGRIAFTTAPASGKAVTATFTFYYPCRFTDPLLDFAKFMHQIWRADAVPFESEK